ncbi:MAG TPA: hypothetical protein VNU96_14080 [Burkholderiales bacterium]|nr:hypothetical protein [Burkholderiales bacterium]
MAFELHAARAIRACLIAALLLLISASCTGEPAGGGAAAQAEVRVIDDLYRRNLADDAFARDAFQPRERGLRAQVMRAKTDSRIPAPPDAVVLLVLYRVPETGEPVGWQLELESVDKDGKPRAVSIALRDPPLDPRETQRPIPPPNVKIPPGLISVGAFWVDLTPLVERRLLIPGRQARVRHGSFQAAVPVNY